MFKFNSIVVVSAILILLPILVNSQKSIEIKGYAIDENDKPVSGARVFWVYEPEKPSRDSLVTSWDSFSDGFFGFNTEWKSKKSIRVFIQSGDSKCFNPINITDERLRKLPKFQGILITKYSQSVDLGRVRDYIKFGKLKMNLENASDTFIKDIKERLIYLRIKDLSGNVVSDTTINRAYSESPRRLEFCLPEGVWCLELYAGEKNSISIRPRKVNVNSQVSVINIALIDDK